jgi:hypothetical protein
MVGIVALASGEIINLRSMHTKGQLILHLDEWCEVGARGGGGCGSRRISVLAGFAQSHAH